MTSESARHLIRTASAIAALTLIATSASAAEGRIPIWEPTTITQPGHYVLTQNVSGTVDPLVQRGLILIQSSGVTVDLNGFEVRVTAGCGFNNCGGVVAANVTDITVRNGTIIGLTGAGVTFSNVERSELSDLRILTTGSILYGIHASGNGSDSMHIMRNRITGNGIRMDAGGLVQDNVIVDAPEFGIFFGEIDRDTSCIVRGNQIKQAQTGIYIDGDFNLIEDNLVIGSDTGIVFDLNASDNHYRGNVVRGSSTAALSDLGTGNTSAGDNYMPGLQ